MDDWADHVEYRRQAALAALGRRAVAPSDVAILIQDAAALIAETLNTDHYGAAELNAATGQLTLRFAATSCDGLGQRQFVESQSRFDKRDSLAAYALEMAEVIIVSDLAADERRKDQFLHQQGIRSALAVPLKAGDQAFGALGAFSTRTHDFSPVDVLFAETIAHLVTTTIARDRTQKALDEERRFTSSILATVDAIVLVLDTAGRIKNVNEACRRATEFTSDDIVDRSLWNTLVVHDDVKSFRAAAEQVAAGGKPAELEARLLTKSGERRRVRWHLVATRSAVGGLESIVATGIDVTSQRLALERAADRSAAFPPPGEPAIDAAAPFQPRPAAPQAERRSRPRRDFKFLQRIAPIVEGKLPGHREFHAVHCRDISSGGFSFVATEPPVHSTYVVVLGAAPVNIYLTAQVVHVTAVIRNDRPRYLVGCQYVGRANYPDQPESKQLQGARPT